MQVPVSVMVDRVGPRVLVAGAVPWRWAGELALAHVPRRAGRARILVGAGDA
jgi:hypothetical protein